ncbi:MAG TPA: fibronectin type III domain-containing protein [Verrucomicrobiae bacterium]
MAIRRSFNRLCQFIQAGVFVSAVTATNINAATLVWNANPEPDVAGYKVFWGETNVSPMTIDVGKVTERPFTNLVAGRTYQFYLTAYNTAGLESSPSSTILYTQPASVAPAAPSQLVASGVSQNEIALRWTDNSANETGFRVLRKIGATGTYTSVQLAANTPSYTDFNVSPATEYFYKVQAFNSAGNSPDSQELRVVTPGNQPPISVTTTAEFVANDDLNQGFWRGNYGKDGAASTPGYFYFPGYVQITAKWNYGLLWANSTTDARALQKYWTTDHFAGAWYNTNAFEYYLKFTNTAIHQVSFYFVDFDRQGRDQLLEIRNLDTGKRLGMERISNFEEGRWSTWNLQGNIAIRVSRLAGPNAVLSAMFFDPVRQATANFADIDPTTSGSWINNYGSQGGFASVSGQLTAPTFVQLTNANPALTWSASTTDARALQKTTGSDRFAGAWNSANQLTFDLNFTDAVAHQVSFYFLDFDRAGREQDLEILDLSSGNRLVSAVISDFGNGVYYSYNLKGKVRIKITKAAGPNAVLSAMFFDAPGANHAQFVQSDTSSSGTWRGTYGAAGQVIAKETPALPSYATFTVADASPGYWAANTTDTRALQRASGTTRVASTWTSTRPFTARVNLNGGAPHNVSLYFVDFNNLDREQLVEVIDPDTGLVLDSTLLTDFQSGVWLTYQVTGDILVRVTGLNMSGVLSGVFFD